MRDRMALDEAIEHAKEMAAKLVDGDNLLGDCKKEHAQLAGWLEELKSHRKTLAGWLEELKSYRKTLAVLASHEPSWTDDFCRARAALKPVEEGSSMGPPKCQGCECDMPIDDFLDLRIGQPFLCKKCQLEREAKADGSE
jgi:hypothetical protein